MSIEPQTASALLTTQHRKPPLPRAEWLAAVVAGLAASPDLWRTRVRHDPLRRTYALLLATPVYDAWVLAWSPGQSIPMHDHGESAGALCVVEGRLVEEVTTDDPERGPRRRRLVPDEPVTFGPRHRHGIANPHDAPATSVHVYSPPLTTMTYYEGDDAVTGWAR